MTQLAVGRAFDGLDVAPREMSFDGTRLSLAGPILPTSFDILQAARDRIVALSSNRDEPDVPVTFTVDPSIDGYYRPVSSGCVLYDHSPTTGYAQWAIDLERVGGGPTPQMEVYSFHAVRTNSHSISDATLNGGDRRFIAMPGGALDLNDVVGAYNRTSASGVVDLVDISLAAPFSTASTFSVPPATAYTGACHIRTTYGAATSQLVGGHHAPGLFGDGWVLSNDLIRVSAHATSTALRFEVYDGSQWENLGGSVGWRLEHDYAAGSNAQWEIADAPVTILRNSPEACTIRLVVPNSRTITVFGRVWIDLTVKRGDRMVRGVLRTDTLGTGSSGDVALEPTASIAATALTGSLRATSNDAAGNRAIWAIANGSPSNNTTTGRITQATGQLVTPFMVGVELAGSGAGFIEAAQEVTYQYYDVRNETQRMVRR